MLSESARHRVHSRRIVRRGDLAVIGLLSAVSGCAHNASPGAADAYVTSGVAALDAWVDQLPGCPPLAELKPATYAPDATFVEVHGPLTLSSTPECLVARCNVDCCNSCTPAWVVIANASQAPARELAIQRSGQARPLSASMKECSVGAVRDRIRRPNVIVTGWLENDPLQPKIVRASLCVVRPPGQPG
jgi:hypothetical protein